MINMGICPRCGSWVDEGEPYCPECCYIGGNDDVVTICGKDYDSDEVERVLRRYGYVMRDLELDMISDDDLDDMIDELERYY